MCAPSPPPAPDYTGAAQAQGAANIEAAKAQGRINNPNVVNPYGTQTVTWDGDQPTLTQSFSPSNQALFDVGQATKLQLSNVAGQGANALTGVVGTPVDFSGAPQAPADYQTLRSSVIDSMMQRPTEDYQRAVDQKNSDLVAAGIRPGTKAYSDQMQLLQRGLNDARTQATVNAGALTTQAYQTDQDRRRQAITELLAQRQTPINEITALMSGSQVSNPFAVPGYAQNAQVGAAPVFAAANAQAQYGTDVYNAKNAYAGQMMGGLFDLGAAGITGFMGA